MAELQILLATRNGEAYLPQQIASIAGQTYPDWSLLASDDRSLDGTRLLLEGMARVLPEMQVLDGPGHGAAANFLSLLARSDRNASYLALADQDDVWFSHKLARAVAVLRRCPAQQPVLYAAQSRLIGEDGKSLRRLGKTRKITPGFSNALVQNIVPGHTIVMNRAAADLAIRAMPRKLPPFHDWWLYALLTGAGARVVIDPEPVLNYRQHRESLLGTPNGLWAQAHRGRMIVNGTWRRWLTAHHSALGSVAQHLTPHHRQALLPLLLAEGHVARLRALRQSRATRQGRLGTSVLRASALMGLA